MEDPLESQYLYAEGEVVLSLEEFQSCFRGEASEAAASSDESLQIVRRAVERLEAILAGHGTQAMSEGHEAS